MKKCMICARWLTLGLLLLVTAIARGQGSNPVLTLRPAGNTGFDVLADGTVVAPIRLAANGALLAAQVETTARSVKLSGLYSKDALAVTFDAGDFVSITLPDPNSTNLPVIPEPLVQFRLTLRSFNTNRWLAMFSGGPAPFHFLICPLPGAKVWHQRGWLNATPLADPFPLLEDVHDGSPELSCLWNRSWS